MEATNLRQRFVLERLRFHELIPGEGLWEPEQAVYSAIVEFTESIPSSSWKRSLIETCGALGRSSIHYQPQASFRSTKLKLPNDAIFQTATYQGPAFIGFRITSLKG